jgi:hypothetical protein
LSQRLWIKIKQEMTMKTLFSWLVVSGFLLMAACQSVARPEENQEITDSSPVVPSETIEPVEILPQPPSSDSNSGNEGVTMPDVTTTPDPNAQILIQIAKKSLAQKLKINVDQIQLSKIETVIWPDASLGCPQPRIMYAQVVTPGYKFLLEANGQTYPYHTDDKDHVVLCAIRSGGEFFFTPNP